MKMKRWVCPTCGAGKNAPGKPRRNDVRRYCLPCSEKTGRLVERVCPALDKKRLKTAAARQERSTRAKAAVEARECLQWHTHGFDVRKEWDKMRRTRAIRREIGPRRLKKAEQHVTLRRSKGKPYVSGHAEYDSMRVVVTVGERSRRGEVLGTILHEMCHLAAAVRIRKAWGGRVISREKPSTAVWGPHGEHFNGILTNAAKELWGIRLDGPWTGYARSWQLESLLSTLIDKNTHGQDDDDIDQGE